MSEVFELPISGDRLEKVMLEADFCTEQDCAAHAINHVDVLADALDECLEDMELEGKHTDRTYMLAKTALAAYRGWEVGIIITEELIIQDFT